MLVRRCGVVGDPAQHSLSPAIHRAGYAANDLAWQYDAYTVSSDRFIDFVSRCRSDRHWRGLSVTSPHKQVALQLGTPDELAQLVGCGNTLIFNETETQVVNTDVGGFVRAWRAYDLPTPKYAAIVGNGATARSLIVALAGLEIRELTIIAREPNRATSLVKLGSALGISVTVLGLEDPLANYDLLASTIPSRATDAYALKWTAAAKIVFDVVYDPWPTPLAKAATALDRIQLNGLDLLAGQAIDQFKIFTGKALSFAFARQACELELNARQIL